MSFRASRASQVPAATVTQPTTRAEQVTTFSPPIATQRSMWASIVDGNLIGAKIFAFSRRRHEHGRVTAPKGLFVNTRVLAAACDYFRSSGLSIFVRGSPIYHYPLSTSCSSPTPRSTTSSRKAPQGFRPVCYFSATILCTRNLCVPTVYKNRKAKHKERPRSLEPRVLNPEYRSLAVRRLERVRLSGSSRILRDI